MPSSVCTIDLTINHLNDRNTPTTYSKAEAIIPCQKKKKNKNE